MTFPDLDVDTLIIAMAGAAAFVSVYAVWLGLLAGDPMGGRVKALHRHRQALKEGLTAPSGHAVRRIDAAGVMHAVIKRLDLLRSRQAAKTAQRLAGAGWRSRDAVVAYLFLKVCLPFVFGGAAMAALFLLNLLDSASPVALLTGMASVVAGAYAPDLFVRNAADKRRKRILKGLPDGLDLLVICSEAGLAVDAALTRVAAEMARSCPELADEIGLTAVELGFLPERRKALENLAERTAMRAIRGVVNTLLQTEKYGTPLAQSLRVLAAEYRNERMLKAEDKAAKLPATLTVPLIAFILPTLFVVLLGPAILRAIDGLGGL